MRPFRRPPSVNPTSLDAGCRLGVGPSMVKGFGGSLSGMAPRMVREPYSRGGAGRGAAGSRCPNADDGSYLGSGAHVRLGHRRKRGKWWLIGIINTYAWSVVARYLEYTTVAGPIRPGTPCINTIARDPPSQLDAEMSIKALTFDVFGTVVDWRSTAHEEPVRLAREKIDSPEYERLPGSLQARLKALTRDDWATFAQQWRHSYAVLRPIGAQGTPPNRPGHAIAGVRLVGIVYMLQIGASTGTIRDIPCSSYTKRRSVSSPVGNCGKPQRDRSISSKRTGKATVRRRPEQDRGSRCAILHDAQLAPRP
ncbi:hypothetical protein DL770_004789 [Monosporascus sp. CRB-9-2]|nr:hypothetical protein DL770_004789 [Monosporascus sp. CRB-9-2]